APRTDLKNAVCWTNFYRNAWGAKRGFVANDHCFETPVLSNFVRTFHRVVRLFPRGVSTQVSLEPAGRSIARVAGAPSPVTEHAKYALRAFIRAARDDHTTTRAQATLEELRLRTHVVADGADHTPSIPRCVFAPIAPHRDAFRVGRWKSAR